MAAWKISSTWRQRSGVIGKVESQKSKVESRKLTLHRMLSTFDFLLTTHLAQKPCPREPHFTSDCGGRDAERRRDLLVGQAAEVAHLDDARFALVEPRQRCQRVVE